MVDNVTALYYNRDYSWHTPNRTTIRYYAIWVPDEDIGKVKSITIQFTNLTYSWHRVSVSPITIAYTYGETLANFNLATATTETIYFNQFFSLALTPTSVNQWLLLAIRADESSSGHLTADVLVSPFLLTPDSALESTVNRYAGTLQSFIFLYSPEYTPITLSTAVDTAVKL